MYWAALPVWFIVEVVYLIRHPKTFNGLACVVGLSFAGLSYLFLFTGKPPVVALLTQLGAVWVYYFIKLRR